MFQKVRRYLLSEINAMVERKPRKLADLRKLVNMSLARLIMFNAKRGGEASRMSVDDFRNRTKEEIRDDFALTPIEKKMMERYKSPF